MKLSNFGSKILSLAVLLVGMIVNLGIKEKKDLQSFSE